LSSIQNKAGKVLDQQQEEMDSQQEEIDPLPEERKPQQEEKNAADFEGEEKAVLRLRWHEGLVNQAVEYFKQEERYQFRRPYYTKTPPFHYRQYIVTIRKGMVNDMKKAVEEKGVFEFFVGGGEKAGKKVEVTGVKFLKMVAPPHVIAKGKGVTKGKGITQKKREVKDEEEPEVFIMEDD
jgi:hypothetical protein